MNEQSNPTLRERVMADAAARPLAEAVTMLTGAIWRAMFYAENSAVAMDLLVQFDAGIARLKALGITAGVDAGQPQEYYQDPAHFMAWLAGQWVEVNDHTGNRVAIAATLADPGHGYIVVTPLYPLCKFTYIELAMTHQELTGREEAPDDAR